MFHLGEGGVRQKKENVHFGMFNFFFFAPSPKEIVHKVSSKHAGSFSEYICSNSNSTSNCYLAQSAQALLDEGGNDRTVITEVCLAVLNLSREPVHPHIFVAVDVVHSCVIPVEILIPTNDSGCLTLYSIFLVASLSTIIPFVDTNFP